jgi:sn-glycerol 3-phosphate transport system substrate-binding protein
MKNRYAFLALIIILSIAAAVFYSRDRGGPAGTAPDAGQTPPPGIASGDGQVADGQAEPVEIMFWNVFADGSDTGAFLDRAAKAFMAENPGITVTVNGQGGYDAIAERLETAAVSGNLPTAAIIEETFLGRFNPLAADLSLYISEDVISNYQPGLLTTGYFNGTLYAVPFNRSMPVLFYNKTMFDEKGAAPPATWEEFRETASHLTDPERGIRGAGLCWDTDAWVFESILYSWGGDILDEPNKTVVFNENGKAAETVGFFRGMASDGTLFNPYLSSEDPWITLSAEMLAGRLGMMLSSTGMFRQVSQWMADAGYELGMAAQPSLSGTPSVATGAGNIMMFDGASEEQKAAAGKFIEFLAGDKYVMEYTALSGYLPTTVTAAGSAEMLAMIAQNPTYQTAIDQMAFTHRRPMTKNWKAMYSVIVDELVLCMRDTSADAGAAMRSAGEACQKLLDENPD